MRFVFEKVYIFKRLFSAMHLLSISQLFCNVKVMTVK